MYAIRSYYGEGVAESYVNLIPTVQGGTHVNGLRMGLTEAVRAYAYPASIVPVIVGSAFAVITSYSIHYTKLYDMPFDVPWEYSVRVSRCRSYNFV